MKLRPSILHSKLLIPKANEALPRPRLVGALQEIRLKKLALVIAGAGYGKTTLVAQTMANLGADAVWYSLDEADQDFVTFLNYLATGIRKIHPGFGKDWEDTRQVSLTSPQQREGLLRNFLAEVERHLDDDLIMVLDDFYRVQDSPDIAQTLEFLLAQMPPTLHLILVSRTAPPLKISRLRAHAEIIELGEPDLSFRPEETEQLYKKCLEADISASGIARLQQKTQGWAAGLILCYHARKSNPTQDLDRWEVGSGSRSFIHQYFAENIFAPQPEAIRDFLLKSSLLSQLEPDLCEALFPGRPTRQILETLWTQHLFTFPYGETGSHFQYHHLFQDFLRTTLARDYNREEVAKLHQVIGTAWEARGNIPEALRHFLAGRHYRDLCRLLGGMVFYDFLDCSLGFLREVLQQIPAAMRERDARLIYLQARLASLAGDLRQAIAGLHNALDNFQAMGDTVGADSCLKDLGFHYYLTGDVQSAYRQMQDLWGKPHADPFFPAEVAGYLILFASLLGKMSEADSYFDCVHTSLLGVDETNKKLISAWLNLCYSNRHHLAGDFGKAMELTLDSLDTFTQAGMEPFLPLANFQAALTSYYLCQPAEGYSYAVTGLSLAEKLGIYDHQYAWLLYARAMNGMARDAVQALRDAQASLVIFGRHGNAWGQASVYELLGTLQRREQKWTAAQESLEAGLHALAGLSMPAIQMALNLERAELLIDTRTSQDALKLLEGIRLESCISTFHVFRRHLLSSRIYAEQGDAGRAVATLQRALELSRENSYHAWFGKAGGWLAPILAQCYAQGIMPEEVEKILAAAGQEAGKALSRLKRGANSRLRRTVTRLEAVVPPKTLVPLRIQCLGTFSVAIGDEAIPAASWRSSKGEKLFKYLVVKGRQEFVPKDELLEALWPQEDPVTTSKRFHVALSWLRRLLEPHLQRGEPSSYILRQDDTYRLEVGPGGGIDWQDFEQAAVRAENIATTDADVTPAHLLKAVALYGGPLFPADPYDDWLEPARERLHDLYLRVLARIIALFEKQGNWTKVSEYAEQYLIIDPYAEPIYGALMRGQARLGEMGRLVRTFARCSEKIEVDLGCPVSDAIVDLYHRLTSRKAE